VSNYREIPFSLVQPIHERRRLVVGSVPEIVEQRPDQFSTVPLMIRIMP
jgi:hypothetical protein